MARGTAHRPQAARTDMPAEPTQALRFGKAREARSATLIEDYVELIADLLAAHGEARATEIAKRLGRNPSDRAEKHRAAEARGASDLAPLSRHFSHRGGPGARRQGARAPSPDRGTAASRRRAAGGRRGRRRGHGAPRLGGDAEGVRAVSGEAEVERRNLKRPRLLARDRRAAAAQHVFLDLAGRGLRQFAQRKKPTSAS